MKKILFCLALLFCLNADAQNIKPNDRVLKDTTIKGTLYQIYLGSRGGKYIKVTKKDKTTTYRKYIK